MRITVNIEAETTGEYKRGLQALCEGLAQCGPTVATVTPEVGEPEPEEKAELEQNKTFKKISYFYHPESGRYICYKKGDPIPDIVGGFMVINKREYDAGIKKQKEEAAEAKKQEGPAVSTDSISDTEPSGTGEPVKPTEEEDVVNDVSATIGAYPGATKADIVAAMQEAQKAGKLSAVKTALGRFNATKISELKEEHFSAFLTDLEVLVKE